MHGLVHLILIQITKPNFDNLNESENEESNSISLTGAYEDIVTYNEKQAKMFLPLLPQIHAHEIIDISLIRTKYFISLDLYKSISYVVSKFKLVIVSPIVFIVYIDKLLNPMTTNMLR